ncbi:dTDP-glucose 4,6-dehydratase [Snodgrassella sp.]|uniref:dTDP-glucose 4,6-dehydratase n=1 Tax=Snodgrassella sp. TaxID=2815304 RepID=UPI0025870AB8|nr:dTDP-glucose 4,6-dehydratase [Snodgrassella sp.]
MNIIVTGGAGFIGSAVIRYLINNTPHQVFNIDKLTYASNIESLDSIVKSPRYHFAKTDIVNRNELSSIFQNFQPNAIIHLAAESHVDRSLINPEEFIQTNIIGTFQLLQQSYQYWSKLDKTEKKFFRFLHISTDEVFGDMYESKKLFSENCQYLPSSPYSASKASADHLVRAWNRSYGLPTLITNSSNNYGPYQHPEKFIPKIIINALSGLSIPVYGNGQQIRDWLYVEDHVHAIYKVLTTATIGQSYNIGAGNQIKNIDIVYTICQLLEELAPKKPSNIKNYVDLISYIKDRPGHDKCYGINNNKITKELHWKPQESFNTGLYKTVLWYLDYIKKYNHAFKSM